jgi:hypothetical protein
VVSTMCVLMLSSRALYTLMPPELPVLASTPHPAVGGRGMVLVMALAVVRTKKYVSNQTLIMCDSWV